MSSIDKLRGVQDDTLGRVLSRWFYVLVIIVLKRLSRINRETIGIFVELDTKVYVVPGSCNLLQVRVIITWKY